MSKITLYCHSGNDQVLSIDPNSLTIITLLHWFEVGFEIVTCCTINESPTKELPALVINENIYSGYRDISRALKDSNLIKITTNASDISTLANREFLIQMNQDLLNEEFSNEDLFKNFTEPALLNAKSRYFWNFVKSRIFPLNYQIPTDHTSTLIQISNKSQRIDECLKTVNATSIENKILLFSHLVIRSLLPKQYQFPGLSEFIHEISIVLDRKEFKGKVTKKAAESDTGFKPVYKHQSATEDFEENKTGLTKMNAYTGLFGVIFAVAVLYSIKNR